MLKNMDFRARRQLIIIVIVLAAILTPIGLLIYKNLPEPTCFDNKQNQGEEGADCGGPCTPCALKHPEDMSVFWTRFVPVRENTYDVAAEIRNPNLKLGAAKFEYEFRFFDDAGVLVAARPGSSFVFPDETFHVIETGIQTPRTLRRVTLVVSGAEWLFTDITPPDVVIGGKTISVLPVERETTVRATLVNRSLVDFREVFVTALIFDEKGNILAASKITEKNLASGESRPVFFFWPLEIDDENVSVSVEARVNTLGK